MAPPKKEGGGRKRGGRWMNLSIERGERGKKGKGHFRGQPALTPFLEGEKMGRKRKGAY